MLDNRRLLDQSLSDLLSLLPAPIREWIEEQPEANQTVEIVLDQGRPPELRFVSPEGGYDFKSYTEYAVAQEDIQQVLNNPLVSSIQDNNRAGMKGTLHRISALRDKAGTPIGLTMRVGRLIEGTIDVIRDILESGESVLILGRPGVGKTSKLREASRYLANDLRRRVMIVDTSNEIAGESVVPHASVGAARRIMVTRKSEQINRMTEAVENHMPEVIVIDEISLSDEAHAAATISERGVQLLATAHGNTLENVLRNPPLSRLVGGMKAVPISDAEVKRQGTSKIVERRTNLPVFNKVVEILDYNTVAVHHDVTAAVDAILRGEPVYPEIREATGDNTYRVKRPNIIPKPREVRDNPTDRYRLVLKNPVNKPDSKFQKNDFAPKHARNKRRR